MGWLAKQEYKNAIADASEAIRLNPERASSYYARGAVFMEMEDYENAVEDFDRAIRANLGASSDDFLRNLVAQRSTRTRCRAEKEAAIRSCHR